MATVGEQLAIPEDGWRRVNDSDSRFLYLGTGWSLYSDSNFYNSNYHGTSVTSSSISFSFFGTKLRIISTINNAGTLPTLNVTIDGTLVGNYNLNSGEFTKNVLVFEKIGLTRDNHTVQITCKSAGSNGSKWAIVWDAIDIESDGYMIPKSPVPSNLNATPGDSQVALNWDAVTGALSYNIKRSITLGGPYETIATVSGTSYLDTNVVNGVTYYYVVTATNIDEESDKSNEANATPVEEGQGLLRITMSDSSEREYPLTAAELDGFINWFNKHTSTDDTSFMFNKTVGSQASKEYLAFNKIISFEVIPLPAE